MTENEDLAPSAYAAMALIRNGVNTGYAIKQSLDRFASFFWSTSYGQIYPVLRKLEAAGMIEGHDSTSTGRLRREYTNTDKGTESLGRWLAEPREVSVWVQHEGILRLMLVDWDDRELARARLGELKAATVARLERIARLTPPRERGQRIQRLGVCQLEAVLAWCEETEAVLAKPPKGDSDAKAA